MSLAPTFEEFLTLPAYKLIDQPTPPSRKESRQGALRRRRRSNASG
jgi:hypothetical protein